MATASLPLIQSIQSATIKLEASSVYQWGHMGSCNCGFLAQEVTKLTKEEIHMRAMMRHGDWTEQLNDYCPINGLPMDDVISELLAFGFDADDLKHLEKLSDGRILRTLPIDERDLKHNLKKDVIKYLKAWANLLEEELILKIALPSFEEKLALAD
jgi:hypothetical protein